MYLIIFIVVIIILLIKFRNYKILWNTINKPKLSIVDDSYGCYFVTGKQGSFKTYYAVLLSLQQDKEKVNYIKTNIHSLKVPGFKMVYFDKVKDIYKDTDSRVIYIIDEVSRKYSKTSKTDEQFYAWLNQCRKRKRMCIMITQEWRELPMWLRRPVKIMITSRRLIGNILLTTISDGENLTFDKDEGEYIAPPICYRIHKANNYVGSMYDTFEPINEL